jgi:hypothetical protein
MAVLPNGEAVIRKDEDLSTAIFNNGEAEASLGEEAEEAEEEEEENE